MSAEATACRRARCLASRWLRYGLLLLLPAMRVAAQSSVVDLWPGGAPGMEPHSPREAVRLTPEGEHVITHVQEPSVTVYLPTTDSSSGAAVVVIPGGGHSELWMDHEGSSVAEFLQSHGVAAFVLRYRLAREKGSTYTVEGTELGDLQRAIRLVRSRSLEWHIKPGRVGVLGFSAGGELAALASTRFDAGSTDSADPVERFSSKPDFQGLIYPAIPREMRLTPASPPAFLACGAQDREDISQGVARLYLELATLHVATELHIFAGVGHGFGLRAGTQGAVAGWPSLWLQWLKTEGMLPQ